MMNKKGFTMVELLVVLLIIGILAAVAAPLYLSNTDKAKVSEAVGAMSLIRQAERDYYLSHNSTYLDVALGKLSGSPDDSTAGNRGLGINVGAVQYFATGAYSVSTSGTFPSTAGLTAVNFVITANPNGIADVTAGDGARSSSQVQNYRVIMDNSGKVFYSTDSGTNWKAYN
ncbi:MAG: type II secretion system protein [Candidatus Omnitrophica bacterium]|nr:type II secretion system protein [Candidatus Omnitrophota bacterium]